MHAPNSYRQVKNGIDSGTTAHGGHAGGLNCPASLCSEQRGNARLEFKEGAFRHSKHSLEDFVINLQKLRSDACALPVNVTFSAEDSSYAVSSHKFLCALPHSFHTNDQDRNNASGEEVLAKLRLCVGSVVHFFRINNEEVWIVYSFE